MKCASTDLSENLHRLTVLDIGSLNASMTLLEFYVVRKYISLASAAVIEKLSSKEFSVILKENIEFLIDGCERFELPD